MCWADRLGIMTAIVVAFVILLIFNGEPIPPGAWLGYEAMLTLPIWALARMLNFVVRG